MRKKQEKGKIAVCPHWGRRFVANNWLQTSDSSGVRQKQNMHLLKIYKIDELHNLIGTNPKRGHTFVARNQL